MSIDNFKALIPDTTDAVMLISPENRFYFTGFSSSEGCLIITKSEALFFTDGRYIEAAQKAIKGCKVIESKNFYAQLQELFIRLSIKTVALEAEKITIAQLDLYRKKFKDIEFLTTAFADDAIGKLRALKSLRELECIKTAQQISEKAFEHILSVIKPGIMEREIALELDYFMLKNGAEALSFKTIAVSGLNSSLPHGVPSSKALEAGDFLTLDFGAVYKGYHSDMTRTLALGKVSPEQKEVYSIVLKAQEKSLASLKNGVSCREADAAARDYISSCGYGDFFSHGTGHGVGIEIHEHPRLSPKAEGILCTGNVVTVEPGIYIPGKFGVRIEDMAYITDDGCVNLTSATKELMEIKIRV